MLLPQVQTLLRLPAINAPSHPPPAHSQAHGESLFSRALPSPPLLPAPFQTQTRSSGKCDRRGAADNSGPSCGQLEQQRLGCSPGWSKQWPGGAGGPGGGQCGTPSRLAPSALLGFHVTAGRPGTAPAPAASPGAGSSRGGGCGDPGLGGTSLGWGSQGWWRGRGMDGATRGGAEREGWRCPEVVPG